MSHVLVWDLPVRLFHWLLAGGLIAAAGISLLLGEHSPLFPYHSMIGLVLTLIVALRLIWGLIGTRYARFGSFMFGPAAVVEYFRTTITGGGKRHIGHNPASSYAIFAMIAILSGLAITGIMLGGGNEIAKEVHEVLAYLIVVVAVIHVLGVALHTLRYRENLTAGMIHGKKLAEDAFGIRSARPFTALVSLALVGAWGIGLLRNYDPVVRNTRLPVLGTHLQLGEAGNERGESGTSDHRDRDDDD
ncbi:MAG: cytochrome b/b6 domain-containing protein [Planctomycetes bacterium]|nr:cytochrome b/b6 domain-containing protein [Planctomycetota bacterium]